VSRDFLGFVSPNPLSPSIASIKNHAQELIGAYKGADPDLPMQRSSVAKFVGLSIPEPAANDAEDKGAKYRAAVAARIAGPADKAVKNFVGVDNLKAQLYGVDALMKEKMGAAARADQAAERATGGTTGGSQH
jgi:hypothetical protein